MVEKLQRSSVADPQSRPSNTEVTLLQCAREVIAKGTAIYEASLAAEAVARGQGTANSNIRVAEWVSTLESILRDQQLSDPSDIVPNLPSIVSGDEGHTAVKCQTSAQYAPRESEAFITASDNSDDDLDTDLAKAALDTGTKAFEAQNWDEANSLFQEALRVLQQLPKQQREFCDFFGLQYRLAVCAYHTQEPADAEEALMSLIQQSASSDEQREYIYHAAHLLSYAYIRMGQVECARSQCEKALLARRRLLGKRSDAALESTALMAHIYILLENRARAKSYLAMIPEARREDVLRIVEESLGTTVVQLDPSLPPTPSIFEDSDLAAKRIQSSSSASSVAQPMVDHCNGPISVRISQAPAASVRQRYQPISYNKAYFEDQRSITVTSGSVAGERRDSTATGNDFANEGCSADPEAVGAAALSPSERPDGFGIFKGKTLSRKEILDKIGCQPKDRIEDAVCNADYLAFSGLLNKKKDFWRSKLRKRVRPERVTALHFAALFGEIDIARRLLGSNFNVNEVPYGYSTNLTPLKFAIGARQVDMVSFLIAYGAKPCEPDSWSTLAGQLLNRSWLDKTMSEAERESVPDRIIAIFKILLTHGWDVNMPLEASGGTVLHQAVNFWTGSYKWDLNLRVAITSFLCECGADPFQANTDGKTPYDMASASGHQELLLLLDQGSRKMELYSQPDQPVELYSELDGMI